MFSKFSNGAANQGTLDQRTQEKVHWCLFLETTNTQRIFIFYIGLHMIYDHVSMLTKYSNIVRFLNLSEF